MILQTMLNTKNNLQGVVWWQKPKMTWTFFRTNVLPALGAILIFTAVIIIYYRWRNYAKNIKPKLEKFAASKKEFAAIINSKNYTEDEKKLFMDFSGKIKDMTNPLQIIVSKDVFDKYANVYLADLKKSALPLEEKAKITKHIYFLREKTFL